MYHKRNLANISRLENGAIFEIVLQDDPKQSYTTPPIKLTEEMIQQLEDAGFRCSLVLSRQILPHS